MRAIEPPIRACADAIVLHASFASSLDEAHGLRPWVDDQNFGGCTRRAIEPPIRACADAVILEGTFIGYIDEAKWTKNPLYNLVVTSRAWGRSGFEENGRSCMMAADQRRIKCSYAVLVNGVRVHELAELLHDPGAVTIASIVNQHAAAFELALEHDVDAFLDRCQML